MMRSTCPLNADGRQTGFSLVELMIAIALGAFLVATLGYVLLGARTSFQTLDALSRMQEDARFAFETMAADIRMAGFTGGPASGASPVNLVRDPSVYSSPPWDPNLKDLFGTPLKGYDQEAGDTFPTGVTGETGLTGDALTVVHADTDTEISIANAVGNCSATAVCTLPAWPSSGAPSQGEIFVAADYTHVAVFQVSGVDTGAFTVSHATGTVTPGNSADDLGAFTGDPRARKLYPLRGVTYYVATNDGGEPALFRRRLGHSVTAATATAEEVLEGVEDMQIQYGEDTVNTPPTTVTGYYTADNVTSWSNVLSVRVTLTLVSQQDTRVATTGNGLLRKTVTNTIAVRNRLL